MKHTCRCRYFVYTVVLIREDEVKKVLSEVRGPEATYSVGNQKHTRYVLVGESGRTERSRSIRY